MTAASLQSHGIWAPVATAPRDGTQILCFTTSRDYEISRWDPIVQCWVSKRGFFVEASHWTPLPEPPDEETEGARDRAVRSRAQARTA
jgi:hypothetical protein